MLRKYKFILVFILALILNILVLVWIVPDKKEQEFDIEKTLRNIEQNLIDLNRKVDDQRVVLENLQLQKAINELLITIE